MCGSYLQGAEAAGMLLTELWFYDEQVKDSVDIFAKHDKALLGKKRFMKQMSME